MPGQARLQGTRGLQRLGHQEQDSNLRTFQVPFAGSSLSPLEGQTNAANSI
jgi:hypothetical protein